MGNYRFRLADMMPNAWFYKLRDMSRAKSGNPAHALRKKKSTTTGSKSFYNETTTTTIESSIAVDRFFASPTNTKSFDTRFPYDPPRRSSRKRAKRKTIYMPSPRKNAAKTSSDYGYVIQETGGFPAWLRAGTGSEEVEEDFDESESNGYDSFDSLCELSSSATDIIIDVDEISCNEMHVVDRSTTTVSFDMVSELEELPPILTRPKKLQNDPSTTTKFQNKNYDSIEPKRTPGRKSISRSGGVRIRGNGAKVASKKSETRRRRSIVKAPPCEKNSKGRLYGSESFAIVKSSFDPEKDFRDSMMEMIVENNIRTSKDLEELLACYLSLNSNQYHHTIIKAFEQIWFNMHQLQL